MINFSIITQKKFSFNIFINLNLYKIHIIHLYLKLPSILLCNSISHLSPLSSNLCLLNYNSSLYGKHISGVDVSTIASTGHASTHYPHSIHLCMSMSYNTVRLCPSTRGSVSMLMAPATHAASHSLHAMHRSSPPSYLRSACSPLKMGPCEILSHG